MCFVYIETTTIVHCGQTSPITNKFLFTRCSLNIFSHLYTFLEKNCRQTPCEMKSISSSNVYPLTSEMGENATKIIENYTFLFPLHSTVPLMPLHAKSSFQMSEKIIKCTKKGIFTGPNEAHYVQFLFDISRSLDHIYNIVK